MRRINKVLVPLYRKQEMESEIAQEWLQDSRGQGEISQNVIAKILFRVAHYWATNIDLDEYLDLLTKLYSRLSYKRVYLTESESLTSIYPRIQIGFPLEEKRINETVVRGGANALEEGEWLECASNESMESDFEYETRTDDVQMKAVRIKRKKRAAGAGGIDYGLPSQVQLSIKDPFVYSEEVVYPELNDPRHSDVLNKTVYDAMLPLEQVLPFGYPTEQFFR